MKYTLEEKQKIEIEFWKNSKLESPESESIENIFHKVFEAVVFYQLLNNYLSTFNSSQTILEIGAGQGWASCIVKKIFPSNKVIATDISPFAIASCHKWERVYNTKIDDYFPALSYEIPMESNSVDLIFCFSAAHHFSAHNDTFKELSRLLKTGGKCLYFYEPTCSSLLYPFAYWRVNRKRPEVPEDVLILKELCIAAKSFGLEMTSRYYTSSKNRGYIEGIYYKILSFLPFLRPILPCTANIEFSKTH